MPLTLATFNVKDMFSPRTELERLVFAVKVANVTALLLRADADVVGLQEVGGQDALDPILGRTGDRLGYRERVVGSVDARGIGNALIARTALAASEVRVAHALDLPVFQSGDPRPYAGRIPLRRGIVHAVVEGGAGLGPVHIFVCHLKSKIPSPLQSEAGSAIAPSTARERSEGELRSLLFRSAEALFLRGLIDDVLARDPRAHVAVLGDLNDTLEGTPVRLLSAAGSLRSERLPGALYSCAERIPADRRFTALHGGAPEQIDHILVTDRLFERVQDACILNEALRDHGPFVPGAPPEPDSDHAPLVVRFA